MPIPTSRTQESGKPVIDPMRCDQCGLCVQICKTGTLAFQDKKIAISLNTPFGCIACGHCMALCPQQAITVQGRTLSPQDCLPLPSKETRSHFPELYNLMLTRRSIRDFTDEPVSDEMIQKILDSSSTAPMGIPPSDVSILVLNGKEKVREFVFDFLDHAKKLQWMTSPVVLTLLRPLIGQPAYQAFKSFIIPLFQFLLEKRKQNEDWLFYQAPLAMHFYGSPFSDGADPLIAATYAMLAAESLGLGSCMIGSVHPLLKNSSAAFRKKYGLPKDPGSGIALIFGHPKFHFQQALKRTFKDIHTVE